ncbi:hypothetical protein [Chryseobacterium sp. Mn2064]|uniref:hypothetical protein n=1 Tax=Chryseobacterium sp. Mn2064 TaxID=3395263 RepID=UPI003BE466BF
MKKPLPLFILFLFLINCGHKHQYTDKNHITEKEESNTKNVLQSEYLSDYPVIKDSAKFITNLRQTFDLSITESLDQQKSEKITFFKKIKINGSDQDFYLIEYDWITGPTAEYPWKFQIILTKEGKLVKKLYAQRFELVHIFPQQNPFLLTVSSTGKGNGGHDIYKMTADSMENVYEGKIKTYDAHQDNKVYEPNELKLTIKDFNNDGFNDVAFSGKTVLIQGLTPQGDWYDSETINGKEVNYSVDHPFKKIPVEYIFLYDKKTGHFKEKENYTEKYHLFE